MHVSKFGGSSVANEQTISKVLEIIQNHSSQDEDKIIVVSAQAGVTDQLVKICDSVQTGPGECIKIIREIEKRHLDLLKSFIPAKDQPGVCAEIMSMCNELSDIVKGCFLVGEVTVRSRDLILGFGERLSAYSIAQVFCTKLEKVNYVDARKIIRTDASFGAAKVNFDTSNRLIHDFFSNNKGISIVTGFIAQNEEGFSTTLGRSGSDYTAAIIGAALDADQVEIWTDVNGMMTADPRFVKEAMSIRNLTYHEAMELSHFGAKVVFPATMQPLMKKGIPILVKNTFQPHDEGTLISNSRIENSGQIKGITSLSNIALLNIIGSGMVGVSGISARLFGALSRKGINVVLISQASSEHSICVAIQQERIETAIIELEKEFFNELNNGVISSIDSEQNLSVIAVVGEDMRHCPGISARIFNPMGRNGINIKAIAQGCSELNISMVIAAADLKKALAVLHQSLFGDELLQMHLYVVGTGAIGTRFTEMIQQQKEALQLQKIDLKICGISNSKKMLIGLEEIQLQEFNIQSGEKANLPVFVDRIKSQNLENSVFVDLTASDDTVLFYEYMLKHNIAVVTANKKANTQKMEIYKSLQRTMLNRKTPFQYETNVGAGLPIINVIQGFRASGDHVLKIEAVISGTLNFLLSEFTGDEPFSDLVLFAKENNYAEPDPREDLSGMDVARKCLILARESGWEFEMEDIDVKSLMSERATKAPCVESFFEELKRDDQAFFLKYDDALRRGKRLRYVAEITAEKIDVSMKEVDETSPFYNLRGTENCVCFTTNYYCNYPMVIKGPGAGVDVTASGVLADIVRIAKGWKVGRN